MVDRVEGERSPALLSPVPLGGFGLVGYEQFPGGVRRPWRSLSTSGSAATPLAPGDNHKGSETISIAAVSIWVCGRNLALLACKQHLPASSAVRVALRRLRSEPDGISMSQLEAVREGR
jgi:hypothetical protein